MSKPEQPDQPRHPGHSAQADRPEQPEAWGPPRSKVVTWYDQAARWPAEQACPGSPSCTR
jgi:hypothetical protein